MKNQFFILVVTVVLTVSCAGVPPAVEEDWMIGTSSQRNETIRAGNSGSSPSSIVGHEWKLIEVYIDGRDTLFNRSTLPAEPGNFLTLNFDARNISGAGVPNRYSAPYTISDDQITISLILATMMASFFQPENITEHDFFNYLQNAYSWKLDNDSLELLSKTENGSEVRLVFSL